MGSEILTEVCHGIKSMGMLLPEPFPDLANPKFFLPNMFNVLIQFFRFQVPNIFLCRFHSAQR